MHTIPAVTCSFCRASVLAFSNAAPAFSWCTETHDEDKAIFSCRPFCRVNVGGFNRSTKADVRWFCVLFPSSSFPVFPDPFLLPTGAVADPIFAFVERTSHDTPSPPKDFVLRRRRRRRPSCSVVSSFALCRVNVLLPVVVVPVGRSATTKRIESRARSTNKEQPSK